MLSDIINAAQTPVVVVAIGILLFATYRAFTIGRALVRGVYRNRAFWTGGTMIALILFTLSSNLPTSNPLSTLSFLVIGLALLAFVDSSVEVAREMDFFHRSPLRWQRLRKPLYVLLFAFSTVGAFLYLESSATLSGVGVVLWFTMITLVFSYSAAALVVGARRTPERTMRRFVRMVSLALICMVLFFTIWIPFQPFGATVADLGNLISDCFIPAAAYFLYLAVMSLSPVGRVEKEVSANSIPNGSGDTQPAHP
jgi:hypothetical protein